MDFSLLFAFLLLILLSVRTNAQDGANYKPNQLPNNNKYELQSKLKLDSFNRKHNEGRDLYYGADDVDPDELCLEYMLSFLGGTTDATDNCEGIQNAYVGAHCDVTEDTESESQTNDDDIFTKYNQPACCQSLNNHYHDYCTGSDIIQNTYLLAIVSVLLLCEGVKSLIKKQNLYFLPAAGGCILVGVTIGMVANAVPWFSLNDVSFDQKFFLMVLLPPIIFEAALAVDKKEFRRRRLAIFMFAVLGTILSTFMTGYAVYFASSFFNQALPFIDSLLFGALISSIDPVAILSVLTSLNLTEKDTIFIMVFGESLLNDGVAITLFNTIVNQYNSEQFGFDGILGACAEFLIACFGSIAVGLICGYGCLIYFWALKKYLDPAMEVASIFLWAGVPYYICDIIPLLNGIVAIVTIGFFMDIYISAREEEFAIPSTVEDHEELGTSTSENYVDFEEIPHGISQTTMVSLTLDIRELILREGTFRLSAVADKHVRFVANFLSQLSENIIFVYLGMFLYSDQYEWSTALIFISIISCVLSRWLMVIIICALVYHIMGLRAKWGHILPIDTAVAQRGSRTAKALQNKKIQFVLVLAGLRGAVSLALVESIPLYNAVTGEGSEYKKELKAMTSASILFTLFIFGGSAYYILRRLDIPSDVPRSNDNKAASDSKLTPLQSTPESSISIS